MKLKDTVRKAKPGKVISVDNSAMTDIRTWTRNVRKIKSVINLKTGRRDVLLGEFL